MPDFEISFAPEIEAFTPPQTNRDSVQPLSPTVVSPITPKHQHNFSSASANGAVEVTTVQPVSLRQSRGARLSFLGGRKKEHPPSAHMNGGQTISEESSESSIKAQDTHRRSFFRVASHEPPKPTGYGVSVSASNGTISNGPITRSNTEGSDWVTDSGGVSRGSYDKHGLLSGTPVESIEKEREGFADAGPPPPKVGGVKKRLSLLRLGKRTVKSNGVMGALNEE